MLSRIKLDIQLNKDSYYDIYNENYYDSILIKHYFTSSAFSLCQHEDQRLPDASNYEHSNFVVRWLAARARAQVLCRCHGCVHVPSCSLRPKQPPASRDRQDPSAGSCPSRSFSPWIREYWQALSPVKLLAIRLTKGGYKHER